MTRADLETGVTVFAAVEATRRAGVLFPVLARVFGRQRLITHLGYEHRLSRFMGVWYHTGIRRVERMGGCQSVSSGCVLAKIPHDETAPQVAVYCRACAQTVSVQASERALESLRQRWVAE